MALGVAHWNSNPDAWDILVLGATFLPGIWRISGAVRRVIDVKKSRGKDLARLRDEGYENARLSLTGRFESAESWALMQAVLPGIHPKKKGGLRTPLGISHPVTQFIGISNVYIDEIQTPRLMDNGIMEISMSAIEWIPIPKKKKPDVPAPVTAEGAADEVLPPLFVGALVAGVQETTLPP